MTPWMALLRMELRAKLRERWLWSMLVFTPLLAAAAPFLIGLPDRFTDALEERAKPDDEEEEEDPVVLCVRGDPGLPSAALWVPERRDPPDWLDWPGGWTDLEVADVLVDRLPGTPPVLRVLDLTGDADLQEADDCLWDDIYLERGARLEALGITERPGIVTDLVWLAPAAEDDGTDGPTLVGREAAGAGLLAALLFGTSMLVDLLPRRRRTGLLEMLRGTRATGRDLVLSAVVTGLGANVLGTALMLGGLGASTAALGRFAWPEVPWALIPAWIGMLGTAVPVFARVSELRAAALALMALYFGWLGLAFATLGLVDTSPWLAALVPLGGALVACVTDLGAGPTAVASVVTIATGAGVLGWAARTLDGEEHSGGQLDATLLRRARGQYGPEVAVLFAASLGGATLLQTGLSESGWPALIAAQVGFLLIPALLTPAALGLDRATLFPPARPRPVSLLTAPVIGVGLIGAASVASALAMAVLPVNTKLLELVAGELGALATGPGILLIGLVPAICEEALFRGAIFGLLRRRLGPTATIVVQAALFAVFHVYPFRWAPTFVSGLALGWLRHRTGTLWVPAAVHLSLNCGLALIGWLELDLGANPAWLGVMALGLLALRFVPRRET